MVGFWHTEAGAAHIAMSGSETPLGSVERPAWARSKRAAGSGRKRNDRFRDGNRGKLPFVGIGSADLFTPVSFVEIRLPCAKGAIDAELMDVIARPQQPSRHIGLALRAVPA
jgi:hypothetical protein